MKLSNILLLISPFLLLASPANSGDEVTEPVKITKDDYIQFAACRGLMSGLQRQLTKTLKTVPVGSQADIVALESQAKTLNSELDALLMRVDKKDGKKWIGGKSKVTYNMNSYIVQKPKHTGETVGAFAAEKMADYDKYCKATVARLKQTYR